jgi:hypothetical protein
MNRITSTLKSFITLNNVFITFCIVLYFVIMKFVPNTVPWKTLFAFAFPVAFYYFGHFVKGLDFSKEALPGTLLGLHIPFILVLGLFVPATLVPLFISGMTMFVVGKIVVKII